MWRVCVRVNCVKVLMCVKCVDALDGCVGVEGSESRGVVWCVETKLYLK